jgi:hypothetical protein
VIIWGRGSWREQGGYQEVQGGGWIASGAEIGGGAGGSAQACVCPGNYEKCQVRVHMEPDPQCAASGSGGIIEYERAQRESPSIQGVPCRVSNVASVDMILMSRDSPLRQVLEGLGEREEVLKRVKWWGGEGDIGGMGALKLGEVVCSHFSVEVVGVTATSQPSDHFAVLAQVLLPTETEREGLGESV